MTQKEKDSLLAYQKYLTGKKLQASSIKTYLWHVTKFLADFHDKTLNAVQLKKYQTELFSKYHRVASLNLRLVILNDYLHYQKINWQFTLLTTEKQAIEVLDKNQLNKLFLMASKKTDLSSLRDQALLECLYFSGLKVSEIVSLKKEDFQTKQSALNWQNKKIILPQQSKMNLLKYLNKRTDDSSYLFLNFDRAQKNLNNEQQLSIRSVERILEKYAHQFQPILRITPQTLRHTLAYHLKKDGADINTIQNALHFQNKLAAENYYKKL
jgi:site-specific recombinase XerD